MHMMDYVTFDEEDDDAMTIDVLFLSICIGLEAFQSAVCSAIMLTTSQVDIHSMVYYHCRDHSSKSRSLILLLACIFWLCIRSLEGQIIYSANGRGSRISSILL